MAPLQEETPARLERMESDVRRLAARCARDAPDHLEDLAQVARLALWQALRRRPDAPEPLLVRIAERAMLTERRRGRSVDGRLGLDTRRATRWLMQSLDAPQRESQEPLGDALESGPVHAHNLWESPTEAEAMGHVLYEMLRAILTPQEDAVLTLLLVGYRYRDVERVLHLTEKQVLWAQRLLQKKLALLTEEVPPPIILKGRPRPFHPAPEVASLLSELLEVIRQC